MTYWRDRLERKLENGEELTEWEAKTLFEEDVSRSISLDAYEHQERRKRMPRDVRDKDDRATSHP